MPCRALTCRASRNACLGRCRRASRSGSRFFSRFHALLADAGCAIVSSEEKFAFLVPLAILAKELKDWRIIFSNHWWSIVATRALEQRRYDDAKPQYYQGFRQKISRLSQSRNRCRKLLLQCGRFLDYPTNLAKPINSTTNSESSSARQIRP